MLLLRFFELYTCTKEKNVTENVQIQNLDFQKQHDHEFHHYGQITINVTTV